MRNFKLFLGIFLFSLLATVMQAQNPTFGDLPPASDLTAENIFNSLVDPIYTGLVLVFGYISYLVPGLNKLKVWYRVFAFALVAGLGFHFFGVSILKVASSYLFASGLYLTILENIKKSPKAIADQVANGSQGATSAHL